MDDEGKSKFVVASWDSLGLTGVLEGRIYGSLYLLTAQICGVEMVLLLSHCFGS